MRTFRTTTIAILALSLLSGSAVGVVAQEADPMAPSTFTVERAAEPVVTTDAGSGETVVIAELVSTDQRASGTWTEVVAENQLVPDDGAEYLVQRNAVRLTNAGGSWVGTNRGFLTFSSDGQPPSVQFLAELVGEGGYDGLTMNRAQVGNADDVRDLWVIVPTDEIPAIPELPVE